MSLKLKLTPAETLVLYDVVTLLDHAKDLPEDHPLASETTLGSIRRKLRFLIEKSLTSDDVSDEKKTLYVNAGNLNGDKLTKWMKLQEEKIASLNDAGHLSPDKQLEDVNIVLDDLQARPDYPKNFVRRDKKRRGR